MTTTVDFTTPYVGDSTCDRYIWWIGQELNHPVENIASYAKLIIVEYNKLINGEIDIKQFEENTPTIEEKTPLNYIRGRICIFYPK
jgi:hypothetical protein